MSNHVAHFAINTSDLAASRAFYEGVFGWKFNAWGPPGFYMIETGGGGKPPMGSLQQRREIVQGTPMYGFECTIAVDDIAATAAAIEAHGGVIVMPLCTLAGVGQLLFFRDPGGTIAGAMQYESHLA